MPVSGSPRRRSTGQNAAAREIAGSPAPLRRDSTDEAPCPPATAGPGARAHRPKTGCGQRAGLYHHGNNPLEVIMGVESMGIESIIAMLFVGAIAGWLAGLIVKGYGFGLLGNIAIGIVGAVVAGFLFPRIGLNLEGGIFDAIVHSTIGAVILLVLIKLVKKV
jgi:uncharacterized membrane protein YeaQ/YmgE (transglycosylase-associated protein family)